MHAHLQGPVVSLLTSKCDGPFNTIARGILDWWVQARGIQTQMRGYHLHFYLVFLTKSIALIMIIEAINLNLKVVVPQCRQLPATSTGTKEVGSTVRTQVQVTSEDASQLTERPLADTKNSLLVKV